MTQGRLPFFLLVAVALAAVAGAAPATAEARARMERGAVPAWAGKALVPPASAGAADAVAGARYELVDYQVNLTGAEPEFFHRFRVRLENEQGISAESEISVDFNPAFQTLVWHEMRVIRGEEVRDQFDLDQIRLLQREADWGDKLLDGVVTAVAIPEDIRVGDVLEYSYTLRGQNPIFDGRFFAGYTLAFGVPVERLRVRLRAPAERALRVALRPAAPEARWNFALPEVPTRTEEEGLVLHTVELSGVPALPAEEGAPWWFDPYPMVEFSEFPDWAAVAAWAAALYVDGEALPPELEANVTAWRRLKTAEAVAKAVRFVQEEIRYLGLEFGEDSHRPTPPAEVCARRYGDCKDKSLLLVTLLRHLGVPAWPALVSTTAGPALASALPSPGAFDHVIVMAEIDGRRHWIDPTVTGQRGGPGRWEEPDLHLALLVREGETGLTAIPRPELDRPWIDVRETFTVPDLTGGAVELKVETVLRGARAEAMRRQLASSSRQEIARGFVNFYADLYPGIDEAKPPAFTDDERANEIRVTEHYRIEDFWIEEEGRLIASFYSKELGQVLERPAQPRRRWPLAQAWPLWIRHAIEVRLPERWDVTPADRTEEGEFWKFRTRMQGKGKVVTSEWELKSLREVVPPESVRAYLRLLEKLRGYLGCELSYAPREPKDGRRRQPGD